MGGREVGHWLVGLGKLQSVSLRAPWSVADMALCVCVWLCANIFECVYVCVHVHVYCRASNPSFVLDHKII